LLAWAGSVGEARGQDRTAAVEGDLTCHPLQHHGSIPPMTVYAREVHTGRTFTVRTRENQERYRIRVAAPGTYVVFSRVWPKDTDVGLTFDVLYSRRVLCGEGRECLDGGPIPVSVRSGQRRGGVDLCSPSPWTTGLVERPGGSPAVLPGSDARSLEEVRAASARPPDVLCSRPGVGRRDCLRAGTAGPEVRGAGRGHLVGPQRGGSPSGNGADRVPCLGVTSEPRAWQERGLLLEGAP